MEVAHRGPLEWWISLSGVVGVALPVALTSRQVRGPDESDSLRRTGVAGRVVEEGMAIGRQVHAAYVKALRALQSPCHLVSNGAEPWRMVVWITQITPSGA